MGSPLGPLTAITISPDLNCAVNHADDAVGEFFDDTACATLLAANGVLYGPDYIPAGSSAYPRTSFTPVSGPTLTGTGTRVPYDPYRITTVVDAGTSGLRITEIDTYVAGNPSASVPDGDAFYQTSVTVQNTGASQVIVTLYRAGDCFLQDNDRGFGQTQVDAFATAVACVSSRTLSDGTRVPGGRIEEWRAISAGAAYMEGFYDDVWAAIGSQQMLPNTSRDNDYIDNGAGLSWSFAVPAGDQATRANQFTITKLGCQEDLVNSVGTSSDQVMVLYDARDLWSEKDPHYLARAQAMATAIQARAISTLAEYAALGFPVSGLPRPVKIEVRCDPGPFNLVGSGRPGFTEAADIVKLQADFLHRTMTPYITGLSTQADATPWANLIDHELIHTLQYVADSQAGLWLRYQKDGDYANIEGTAVLGQDLVGGPGGGVDDASVATEGSFLQAVNRFLNVPLPIDTNANNDSAYQVAGFYEYLAERFGDRGLPNLEQQAAELARRLYSGPVHLAGVREAIGASTMGPVFDALRDFYVTAYVRRAPNQEDLPERLRILDETTAHGQPVGTGATPPSWGTVRRTVSPDAVSSTVDVTFTNPSLEPASGIVYEVPLGLGLSQVHVTVTDHPHGFFQLKGHQPPDRLRVGVVSVSAGSVAIDPAFFLTGPTPTNVEGRDIPVVGMDKIAIAVVAGRQNADYEIKVEATTGVASITMDPIPDVAFADQAGGIIAFVSPSVGGVGSRGLPARIFSATVDGVTAPVTAAFDLQGRYELIVKPSPTLDVGSHILVVRYDTMAATPTGTFEVVSGGGGTSPIRSLSASGSLRTALALGGAGQAGTPIEISFTLAEGGFGLPGATVSATVTDPSGVARVYPLTDEGSELDTGWSDGASGVYAYGTNTPGTYTVRVDATGIDASGAPFSVSETRTIALGPMVDADGDGIADSIEPIFGLNPTDSTDGALDPDLDGAPTAAELAAGSDPLNPDTDERGEADGSELSGGRNPLDPADDTVLPPVTVGGIARDGRRIEVSLAARDGTTPVHLYGCSAKR